MSRRHPPTDLPRRWLMTDERLVGEQLWDAVAALPRGSGIVFRHYATPQDARRAIFDRVRALARRRGLMLVVAGAPLDRALPRHGRVHGATTAPVHSRREAVAAIRAGARLLFVSPLYVTRSHPGGRALGRVRLGLMIRDLPVPVIALGGMDEGRWRGLRPLGIHGWAGIDGWAEPVRG